MTGFTNTCLAAIIILFLILQRRLVAKLVLCAGVPRHPSVIISLTGGPKSHCTWDIDQDLAQQRRRRVPRSFLTTIMLRKIRGCTRKCLGGLGCSAKTRQKSAEFWCANTFYRDLGTKPKRPGHVDPIDRIYGTELIPMT
jgi:hypothetical protein